MNPIENVMRISLEQIREMVDVDTVVGDPIVAPNGDMVLPVSKVGLGFVAGGGEYAPQKKIKNSGLEADADSSFPFAGTSAGGMSVSPVAFLYIGEGGVRVIPLQYGSTLDRLIEFIPEAIGIIGESIEGACCGRDDEKEQQQNRE